MKSQILILDFKLKKIFYNRDCEKRISNEFDLKTLQKIKTELRQKEQNVPTDIILTKIRWV